MQKLNNNTLALQALLTKVNNLPEGGSSGGGGASVETCKLTVYNNTENTFWVWATAYDDSDGFYVIDEIMYAHDSISRLGVVCGTSLVVCSDDYTSWMHSSDGLLGVGGVSGLARCYEVDKNITSASLTIMTDDGPPEPI